MQNQERVNVSQPRIGIGVLIFRDGKVLLGRRLGSHGAGDWATPGGHLEFGETPQQCAVREVREETGLALGDTTHGPFTNDFFPVEQKHYVTLFLLAHASSGTPQRCEPEKCAGWTWCDPDNLPQPLFAPLTSLLAQGADLRRLAEKC